jgi:tetratricopeptide (TPR) repeat protein
VRTLAVSLAPSRSLPEKDGQAIDPASTDHRVARRGPSPRSLVVILLASSSPAFAQGVAVWSPGYEAAVLRYRSAAPEPSVSEICAWPPSRLREEVTALGAFRDRVRRSGDAATLSLWYRIPVRAALMLHTDCALGARQERSSAEVHESIAAEIAAMLRDDDANQAFARRWYGVMAGLACRENRWWPDALGWAEKGLRDFPDSADLLVTVGAIDEALALQTSRSDPPPAGEGLADPAVRRMRSRLLQRQEVRDYLQKARQALVAATAADPSLCEAHLRLGRVAWRLGQEAEARSALEAVLAGKHARPEAFLAHLFMGRLDEDSGRLDEAARSYVAALALEVNAQSARLALSQLRLRQGDATIARAEAERAVRPGGSRLRPDPFWLYPWGPSVGVADRLEALRREARP